MKTERRMQRHRNGFIAITMSNSASGGLFFIGFKIVVVTVMLSLFVYNAYPAGKFRAAIPATGFAHRA